MIQSSRKRLEIAFSEEYMQLSTKIKQLRTKANLTQEQLADELGISPQSVSKWENGVSLPDITLLPTISEIFGVSIDELFDLTVEQKLNRIENRMDLEDELPHDVFKEYEEFLKSQINDENHKLRATSLLAHLYWHNMDANARKAAKYSKEAIMLAPEKKDCQWILCQATNGAVWDWNIQNHSKLIDFYKEVIESDKIEPHTPMPYYDLIDNLIADNRLKEAEEYLKKVSALPATKPVLVEVYKAYIALGKHDVKTADAIIEKLVSDNPTDSNALFEAAQYYVRQGKYEEAIKFYNLSYDNEKKRPRFIDAPQAIADIYAIMGDYKKAAEAYDRVIKAQKEEWHMTEEVELKDSIRIRDALLAKANSKHTN